MQSTGHVSIASSINSVLSPSCLIALDLPKSGSITNVFEATLPQYLHPIHADSSTQTARSRNSPPRRGSFPFGTESSFAFAWKATEGSTDNFQRLGIPASNYKFNRSINIIYLFLNLKSFLSSRRENCI